MASPDYDIPKHSSISIGKSKIYYRKYGEGYPVICLPPWMNSSIAYAPLAAELKGSGLQLLALDMPGWGKHAKATPRSVGVDTHIRVLAGFVNKMGLEKYAIIGYSFGGVVAQGAITVENIKPEKLLLVSSLNGGFDIFGLRFKAAVKGLAKVQDSLDRKKTLKRAYVASRKLHIAFKPGSRVDDLVFLDTLLRDIGPISIPNALDSIYSLYGRSFISAKLKSIDTTLIMGDKDYRYVKSGMRQIAKYLGVSITTLKKANHHHLVLRPEKSADLIRKKLLESNSN